MEENKDIQSSEKKLTYEQLENVAMQLQNQVMMMENKLKTIDYTAIRLNWLFEVLKAKEVFKPDFVINCAKEIEDILTIKEVTEEKE